MKRKLKGLALSLSVIMAVAALSGCGNKEAVPGNEGETTSKATESAVTTESSASVEEVIDPLGKYEEEITLTVGWGKEGTPTFYPGHKGYESMEDNLWLTAIKEDLNVNIEYQWISYKSDDHKSKWHLAMAQKKLPDFGYVTEDIYMELLESDLIMDMTDYFEKYASDMYKEFLDADGGMTMAYTSQNGRLMGLPVSGSTADKIQIFNIRQDWLEELNLPVPKTLEDVEKVAKAFVDNKMGGNDTYGIGAMKSPFGNSGGLLGVFHGYGAYPGVWVEQDGKLIYGSVMDENKEALLFLQNMYTNGLMRQDFSVMDANALKEDVSSGKVGIIYGSYSGATGVGVSKNVNSEAEWVVAEIPTVDGSKAVSMTTGGVKGYLFVSKDCEHPEAVVKLANHQISKIFNEDTKVVEQFTTHTAPEGGASVQVSLYVPTISLFGTPLQNMNRHLEACAALEDPNFKFTAALNEKTYNSLKAYKDGDLSQYSQWKIFGPEGTFAVINAMQKDGRIKIDAYQSHKTETMNDKQATLDTEITSAMIKVIMGEDISTYEKAVADWYKNGGQIMTDEANEWYANK